MQERVLSLLEIDADAIVVAGCRTPVFTYTLFVCFYSNFM